MNTILIKDPKHKSITVFLLKAIVLYLIWFISYDFFIAPAGTVDAWLNYRLANDASFILKIIGYDGDTIPGIKQTIVRLHGVSMVGIGNPCNGLDLFALFAGFIICFPGNNSKKIGFITLGILGIHFVNVLRTIALTLIQYKAPEYLDFNHHYTFTIIVYAFIFFMWIIWVNKFSGFNKLIANKKKQTEGEF